MHLARIGAAVVVRVAPDPELGEARIPIVEPVVGVAVERLSQSHEVCLCALEPSREDDLVEMGDFSVGAGVAGGIEVEDEDAVLRGGPGGRLVVAVVIEIHDHLGGGLVDDGDAVAVEIEDDRHAAFGERAGGAAAVVGIGAVVGLAARRRIGGRAWIRHRLAGLVVRAAGLPPAGGSAGGPWAGLPSSRVSWPGGADSAAALGPACSLPMPPGKALSTAGEAP